MSFCFPASAIAWAWETSGDSLTFATGTVEVSREPAGLKLHPNVFLKSTKYSRIQPLSVVSDDYCVIICIKAFTGSKVSSGNIAAMHTTGQ